MTREEIKNNAFWADVSFMEEPVVRLSDALGIIKDFGSRTCENCKYYIEERISLYHDGTEHLCRNEQVGHIVYDYLGKDFGCNKFERK